MWVTIWYLTMNYLPFTTSSPQGIIPFVRAHTVFTLLVCLFVFSRHFLSFLSSDGHCPVAGIVSVKFLAQFVSRSTALDPEAKRQVLGLRSLVKQD